MGSGGVSIGLLGLWLGCGSGRWGCFGGGWLWNCGVIGVGYGIMGKLVLVVGLLDFFYKPTTTTLP